MKILYFCNLVPRKTGAFETFLREFGVYLKTKGDDILLALGGDPAPHVADSWIKAGISWVVVDGWTDKSGCEHPWSFVAPALRILREYKPDVAIVHFGNEMPVVATVLISRLSGFRSVRWVWEQDQQICDADRVTRIISKIRVLSYFVDGMIAAYEGGVRSMIERGVQQKKIYQVYNSVCDYQPDRTRAWLEEEFRISRDAVVVAAVGSLIPRKRIDWILRACSEVMRAGVQQVYLIIAGDGPEKYNLQELALELNISEKVVFAGLRDDVKAILSVSDIMVHCSYAETSTYAVTESMCAGIPCVLTDSGAAREQVLDGCSGYVVECSDLKALTGRLIEMVDDCDLRKKMGNAARGRWASLFDLKKAVLTRRYIYREIAGIPDE